MADANGNEQEIGPPLEQREADLIWHAPAEGLSGTLIFVLFMNAGLVVFLLMSDMILLAFTVLATLAILVVFGLLNAAHLIGPGGITIQRPFGTEAQPWSAFSGWRRYGKDIHLVYADTSGKPPLLLHQGQHADEIARWLDYYLDELPREILAPDDR